MVQGIPYQIARVVVRAIVVLHTGHSLGFLCLEPQDGIDLGVLEVDSLQCELFVRHFLGGLQLCEFVEFLVVAVEFVGETGDALRDVPEVGVHFPEVYVGPFGFLGLAAPVYWKVILFRQNRTILVIEKVNTPRSITFPHALRLNHIMPVVPAHQAIKRVFLEGSHSMLLYWALAQDPWPWGAQDRLLPGRVNTVIMVAFWLRVVLVVIDDRLDAGTENGGIIFLVLRWTDPGSTSVNVGAVGIGIVHSMASPLREIEVEASLRERPIAVFWCVHQQQNFTHRLLEIHMPLPEHCHTSLFLSEDICQQKVVARVSLINKTIDGQISIGGDHADYFSNLPLINWRCHDDEIPPMTLYNSGDEYNIIEISDIRMWWWLLAIYWVLISSLAVTQNLKTFRRMESLRPMPKIEDIFKGLIRTDYSRWNKKRILIGSCTIFPMKFFILAQFLVGALLMASVISICPKTWVPFFQRVMFGYFNIYGKLCVNLSFTIKDESPNKPINTPIIISNHNCWFDTFYITLGHSPLSYVAKYEIQFWPVIGQCAKAMSCIFVKRDTAEGRQSTSQEIQNRVDSYMRQQKTAYPIVIYPEGTTSDNSVILRFKKGAFESRAPVTIFSLKYECADFNAGEDEISQAEHIFLIFSQCPVLKVKRLEASAYEYEDVEQYMNRCRELMRQAWDFGDSSGGYRETRTLMQLRKAQK